MAQGRCVTVSCLGTLVCNLCRANLDRRTAGSKQASLRSSIAFRHTLPEGLPTDGRCCTLIQVNQRMAACLIVHSSLFPHHDRCPRVKERKGAVNGLPKTDRPTVASSPWTPVPLRVTSSFGLGGGMYLNVRDGPARDAHLPAEPTLCYLSTLVS